MLDILFSMRRLLFPFLIALCLASIAHIETKGFSPGAIRTFLSEKEEAPLPKEFEAIFQRPFHYIGKGRQCFVFASEDEKYVLKFFNKRYLEMPWYAFAIKKKERSKRDLRRHFFEHSYEIARLEFGEEILYLHKGKTNALPIIKTVGPATLAFEIDLNQTPFVLQRKGEPFYAGLEAVFAGKGMEGLVKEIDAFAAQVRERILRGIVDGDSDVEHNWGYIGEKIFHLDPGRLYYDPRLKSLQRQKEEWETSVRAFAKWLEKHHPEAMGHLQNPFL